MVAGAAGQLGRALVDCLGPVVAWAGGRDALDVTHAEEVRARVRAVAPDVVVNATAYNKVDAAEAEPEEALAVNLGGALNLAAAAREAGALMVHVSTDYVFDGRGRRPYVETDLPRPLGAYGLSKRAGEIAVEGAAGEWLIVRTSGVFGKGGSRAKGGSFVDRILARARAGEALRVVDDQEFAPTYAPDLATAIAALVQAGARGTFHVTGAGACTWHGLATAALEAAALAAPVERLAAEELRLPARRPAYSVLSCEKYLAGGLPPLREWREALRAHVASLSLHD